MQLYLNNNRELPANHYTVEPTPQFADRIARAREELGPQGITLRAGFEPSTAVFVTDLLTLRSLDVTRTDHFVEYEIETIKDPLASESDQSANAAGRLRQLTGLHLSKILVLDPVFRVEQSAILNRAISEAQVSAVRFSPLLPDPSGPSGTAVYADGLLDLTNYRSQEEPTETLVLIQLSDMRAWWRAHAEQTDLTGVPIGIIPRMPASLRGLLQETPYPDPSFNQPEDNVPPQVVTGQHDPARFSALTGAALTAAQAALAQAQREAQIGGGLYANTPQQSHHARVAPRLETADGARPLTWRETLYRLLFECGAAWISGSSNYFTAIDPSDFEAPLAARNTGTEISPVIVEADDAAYGPVNFSPGVEDPWTRFCRFLHETGHTLEPNLNGTFSITPVLPTSASASRRNSLLDVLRHLDSGSTDPNGAIEHDELVQYGSLPLPSAIAVAHPQGPGGWSWSMMGRLPDPNLRCDAGELPHAVFSIKHLLERIASVPYRTLLPRLGDDSILDKTTSGLLLTGTSDGYWKTIYITCVPADNYADPSVGTVLSDATPTTPQSLSWVPYDHENPNADNPNVDPVTLLYNNPAWARPGYYRPAWFLQPASAPNPAQRTNLYPLDRLAAIELVRMIYTPSQSLLDGFADFLPDRWVPLIHFGMLSRRTKLVRALASPPEPYHPEKLCRELSQDRRRPMTVQFVTACPAGTITRCTVRVLSLAATSSGSNATYPSYDDRRGLEDLPTFFAGGVSLKEQRKPPISPSPADRPFTAQEIASLTPTPVDAGRYVRVEETEIVVENLTNTPVKAQEIHTLTPSTSGNYAVPETSLTRLAYIEVIGNFTADDLTYDARILYEYRSNRVHAQSAAPADDLATFAQFDDQGAERTSEQQTQFLNEQGYRTVKVVNALRRTGSTGQRTVAALAGSMEPWLDPPAEDESDSSPLPYSIDSPLADVTSAYTNEVWAEIPTGVSDGYVQGVVVSSTVAQLLNGGKVLNEGQVIARAFRTKEQLDPFDRSVSYVLDDLVWLTAPAFNENTDYVSGDKVTSGGNVYRAPGAIASGSAFNAGDWTLEDTEGVKCANTTTTADADYDGAEWDDLPDEEGYIETNEPGTVLRNPYDNAPSAGSIIGWIGDVVLPQGGGGGGTPECLDVELNNLGTLAMRTVSATCTGAWTRVPVIQCDDGLLELPGNEPT